MQCHAACNLFAGETILPLVRDQLGFNFTHFRRIPVADGGLQEYLIWMKENLAAGLPVIFVARLKNGETLAVSTLLVVTPGRLCCTTPGMHVLHRLCDCRSQAVVCLRQLAYLVCP